MSSRLMDRGIAAALAAGRTVIVPSAQRAAALRWNWARLKQAQGFEVWPTPDVITWDAWLDAQWEKARLEGRVAAGTRRLNRSQQLQVWRRVLDSLEGRFGAAGELALHAPALMASAARAVQWLLPLSRLAVTDEERLLAAALSEVREWCRRNDCVALPLCTPEQLAQFVSGPPPLVTGQRSPTTLQLALLRQRWPEEPPQQDVAPGPGAGARLVMADNLEQELRACAHWCRTRLAAEPGLRLLLISMTGSPSLHSQAVMLARELCAGTGEVPEDLLEGGLLAVEGGQPLSHQQLIADALCALRLLREPLSFDDLGRVLRSPYLGWADPSQRLSLRDALAEPGFAQWPLEALRATLARLSASHAAAPLLAAWLGGARAWQDRASRVEWARRFSQWLGAAGFGRGASLDSRDAQRLQRWNELLDEFAALDCIGDPLAPGAALDELLGLADAARHAARSGDAAITLSPDSGAPLARHDGIWVLGLAEQRWPEPPRPDPYVPLSEQRRCGWDEAGATQRLEQAQWSLRQWQAATQELVLSYPRLEGDVHHRPSALPGLALPHEWEDCGAMSLPADPCGTATEVPPCGLAPLPAREGGRLDRGLMRLRLQQSCAFRAQAEVRLGARPAPFIGDGIHPAVRGVLLHGVLDGLWRELRDQRALKALDAEGRRALFERHWTLQLSRLAAEGRPPYPQRLLERERLRSERLVLRMLALEEERPFFRVLSGEMPLRLETPAGVVTLRLDRLDEDEQGQHWLIDYKSGRPETFRLATGEAQPLQLVLYEQALAAQDMEVRGVALLSLAPAQAGFSGAAPAAPWPGRWQLVPDWDERRRQWRQELAALLREHAGGEAAVAPLRDACRNCHLTALCRRADSDAEGESEEQADE